MGRKLTMGKGDTSDTHREGRPLGPDLEEGEDIPFPGQDDSDERTRARLSIREAVDRFLARLQDDQARTFFPWPGTPADLPDEPYLRLPFGSLTPELDNDRPNWLPLWARIGPLWPDRLTVLVGATGRGKSSLAVQVAESVARTPGAPVLYASAEMGADELVARLVAIRAKRGKFGVGYGAILRGKALPDDLRAACEALVEACPNLYLWEPRADERTAQALVKVTQAVSEGRPPFVVLDYVQRFVPVGSDDKRLATSAISGTLRDMARPGGLGKDWPGAAVLALSSTARGNYEHFQDCLHLAAAFRGGKVPTEGKNGKEGEKWIPPIPLEGMGKETGELEYDAPLLLCMTTDKGEGPGDRHGLLVVAKNRHGPLGAFRCDWWPVCGRFERFRTEDGSVDPPSESATPIDLTSQGKTRSKGNGSPPGTT
jgi:DnaB-like helicase C terminal domain